MEILKGGKPEGSQKWPFYLSDFGLEKRKTTNLFSLQRGNYGGLPLERLPFHTPPCRSSPHPPPTPPCRQRHCSFEFYNLISVRAVYLGLVASQGWVERGIKTWQPGSGCLRAPASRPRLKTCFLFLFPAASCAAAHYHPLQSPLPASPQNISPSPRPVSGTLVVADI